MYFNMFATHQIMTYYKVRKYFIDDNNRPSMQTLHYQSGFNLLLNGFRA